MTQVTVSNKSTLDNVHVEIIPAVGSSFELQPNAWLLGNRSVRMCLKAMTVPVDPEPVPDPDPPVDPDPEEPPVTYPFSIRQDTDTFKLIIQSEPNLEYNFYSPHIQEDVGKFTTDATGLLEIDVSDEWEWWVPDAETLQIWTTPKPEEIINFKVRVPVEGWIEDYYQISRRLTLSVIPESTYEVTNARSGEVIASGIVTDGYSEDGWDLPVISVDIDKTKCIAGDTFNIVQKYMLNGVEKVIEWYQDTYSKFLEFEEHQVTEVILDDWWTRTVWAGPELTIMTPYAKLAVEAEDYRGIYIRNMEYPAEYEERVELSLSMSPAINTGERLRVKMVIHKNELAIESTKIDSASWFAGFPVIGSQIEVLVIPTGIQTSGTFTQIEDLPTVIPPTLKSVWGWFNHHQGGTPEFWSVVKSWDMSNVNDFRDVFLAAEVTGTTSIGWSMSGNTEGAFRLANITG